RGSRPDAGRRAERRVVRCGTGLARRRGAFRRSRVVARHRATRGLARGDGGRRLSLVPGGAGPRRLGDRGARRGRGGGRRSREPLAWFASPQVSAGEGAAWRGYGAPLAVASPGPVAEDPHRTRAVFQFLDGDFGLDETGLSVERGDSLGLVRMGAFSAERGPR